jgi:NCAIR mutase (PurE)-related protein
MEEAKVAALLAQVKEGNVSPEQALETLRTLPFIHTDTACIDTHRAIRCGFPEVIYCPGKSNADIVEIFGKLIETDVNVLATRAEGAVWEAVREAELCQAGKISYDERARTITYLREPFTELEGDIAIVTAGTADVPVAKEALNTALAMGQNARLIADVGVAGIHRLLSRIEEIRRSNVIVVVAGMEGALASVVAGLVDVPVIAVPTSIGYGASFGGVAALLTMLNSCANGVSVVNIDNGFSAAYSASLINRSKARRQAERE